MSDVVVPRTPTPGSKASKAAYSSPPPLSSSDLTPPPSTQLSKPESAPFLDEISPRRGLRLASPPATTRPTPIGYQESWSGPFPTLDESRSLPESQLRDLINDLIPALGEARMGLAHTKLQLNLLSIETAEAAQRAEAEHDLTRREVEVLQAGSPILRNRTSLFPDPRSPLAQVQNHLEISIKQGRELESENYQLQKRLKQAKKIIKYLDGKNSQLVEDNQLLRERIWQNRQHFNELRASSSNLFKLSPKGNVQSPSQRKAIRKGNSRTRKQDPLDALLMADQILSGEPSSLPATPTPYRASKYNHGHTRGTHSLSSLPSTPTRLSRPITADELLRTPINQIIPTSHYSYSAPSAQVPPMSQDRLREDRDSTISASEDLAMTDEDIPASQASQAASSMLRRYAHPSLPESPSRGKQERLVQTKLTGKVTKYIPTGGKGAISDDGDSDVESGGRSRKRARVGKMNEEQLGLGIGGVFGRPRR